MSLVSHTCKTVLYPIAHSVSSKLCCCWRVLWCCRVPAETEWSHQDNWICMVIRHNIVSVMHELFLFASLQYHLALSLRVKANKLQHCFLKCLEEL